MIRFYGDLADLNKRGIYSIHCLENNKQYIGSTNSFKTRLKDHNTFLKKNKHYNAPMQNSYNKYGASLFQFKILKLCDETLSAEDLLEIEQDYLDKIFEIGDNRVGYFNIAKKAKTPLIGGKSPMTGRHLTDEQKKHLSELNSGEKHPKFGVKLSDEAKKSLSDARFGKGNPNYISEIEARNTETREVITGSSYREIAEKIGTSIGTIQRRLNKDNKKYTITPVNSVWIVYRVGNGEE